MRVLMAILILGISLSYAEAVTYETNEKGEEVIIFAPNESAEEYFDRQEAKEYVPVRSILNGKDVSNEEFYGSVSKSNQEEMARFREIKANTVETYVDDDGDLVHVTSDGVLHSFTDSNGKSMTIDEQIESREKLYTETWQGWHELDAKGKENLKVKKAFDKNEHYQNVIELKKNNAKKQAKREDKRKNGDMIYVNWDNWFERKEKEEKK